MGNTNVLLLGKYGQYGLALPYYMGCGVWAAWYIVVIAGIMAISRYCLPFIPVYLPLVIL
jgi:hypothetical protein